VELKQALDMKALDYRLKDRLLSEGKLTKEQVDKFLKDLPDDQNKSVTLGELNERKKAINNQ